MSLVLFGDHGWGEQDSLQGWGEGHLGSSFSSEESEGGGDEGEGGGAGFGDGVAVLEVIDLEGVEATDAANAFLGIKPDEAVGFDIASEKFSGIKPRAWIEFGIYGKIAAFFAKDANVDFSINISDFGNDDADEKRVLAFGVWEEVESKEGSLSCSAIFKGNPRISEVPIEVEVTIISIHTCNKAIRDRRILGAESCSLPRKSEWISHKGRIQIPIFEIFHEDGVPVDPFVEGAIELAAVGSGIPHAEGGGGREACEAECGEEGNWDLHGKWEGGKNVQRGFHEFSPLRGSRVGKSVDRKSTRLNSSHSVKSRMPSSA